MLATSTGLLLSTASCGSVPGSEGDKLSGAESPGAKSDLFQTCRTGGYSTRSESQIQCGGRAGICEGEVCEPVQVFLNKTGRNAVHRHRDVELPQQHVHNLYPCVLRIHNK